jgi:hypothetical protein
MRIPRDCGRSGTPRELRSTLAVIAGAVFGCLLGSGCGDFGGTYTPFAPIGLAGGTPDYCYRVSLSCTLDDAPSNVAQLALEVVTRTHRGGFPLGEPASWPPAPGARDETWVGFIYDYARHVPDVSGGSDGFRVFQVRRDTHQGVERVIFDVGRNESDGSETLTVELREVDTRLGRAMPGALSPALHDGMFYGQEGLQSGAELGLWCRAPSPSDVRWTFEDMPGACEDLSTPPLRARMVSGNTQDFNGSWMARHGAFCVELRHVLVTVAVDTCAPVWEGDVECRQEAFAYVIFDELYQVELRDSWYQCRHDGVHMTCEAHDHTLILDRMATACDSSTPFR